MVLAVQAISPQLMLVTFNPYDKDKLNDWNAVKQLLAETYTAFEKVNIKECTLPHTVATDKFLTEHGLYHAILFDEDTMDKVIYLRGYIPLYNDTRRGYKFVLVGDNCAAPYNALRGYIGDNHLGEISFKWLDYVPRKRRVKC